jgi:hypothetical protein
VAEAEALAEVVLVVMVIDKLPAVMLVERVPTELVVVAVSVLVVLTWQEAREAAKTERKIEDLMVAIVGKRIKD